MKDPLTLPPTCGRELRTREGPGREVETLTELGGAWCRCREARVNGDQGGCGEAREALIVNVRMFYCSG